MRRMLMNILGQSVARAIQLAILVQITCQLLVLHVIQKQTDSWLPILVNYMINVHVIVCLDIFSSLNMVNNLILIFILACPVIIPVGSVMV